MRQNALREVLRSSRTSGSEAILTLLADGGAVGVGSSPPRLVCAEEEPSRRRVQRAAQDWAWC